MRNQVKELEGSDDAELLAAVREGHDAAFGELYRRHLGAARAAARSLTRSTADADDAVAEAFARVLAVMRRGGGPEVAMRPYLMTVVRNVCFDRTKARARETLPGETEVVTALDEQPTSYQGADLDHFAEANLVNRAFASLSDRWKHVLWQTDIEGRTPRELADELDLAPTAVAALAFRAREGLADAYLAAHVTHRPTAQCRREPSELARYVRNRMRSKEQITFQAHLDQCHRCTEAVEELRVVSRPLRALQWPAILGGPVLAYGAKVIGVIRRVVTAQLLTTAGAAAVTVATVGVATNQVPFEPFDALRPKSYVESQVADPAPSTTIGRSTTTGGGGEGTADVAQSTPGASAAGAGVAPGSHRSALSATTVAAIPTIPIGSGATIPAPTAAAGATPTTAAIGEPSATATTTAAAPTTTDTAAPDDGATPDPAPPAPTSTEPAPAVDPVNNPVSQAGDSGSAPTTPATDPAPPTTVPGGSGMVGTPIGGDPHTQSNGNDPDESNTTTTTAPDSTTTPSPDAGGTR